MMEIYHVIPVNDIKEHEESKFCHCNPTVKDGGCVVVHNSFDGREVFEQARELLNDMN